ncbi:MAG: glycosyltransferase family 39 protein, partial [Anaerolineae bacterium]|nr:glycosyltransferase family 39 protein [Anaerolineae bacterium]
MRNLRAGFKPAPTPKTRVACRGSQTLPKNTRNIPLFKWSLRDDTVGRGAQPCAPTRENDPVNKHKNLTRRIYHRIAILLILLLAAGLRFHALGQDTRFHPDEALFATFARGAAVNGDWLLHGVLDKPPLTIYADALSMMVVGVTTLPDGVLTLDAHRGEFAARLPGTLASLVLVAVMFPLTRRLYPRAGVFPALAAMLLMALSPYALAFSATAFTDGLMLLCLALALWMSAAGRWGWAGFWLAVGFGCKQQALLYVPLVAAVLWIARQTDYHRAGTLACPY